MPVKRQDRKSTKNESKSPKTDSKKKYAGDFSKFIKKDKPKTKKQETTAADDKKGSKYPKQDGRHGIVKKSDSQKQNLYAGKKLKNAEEELMRLNKFIAHAGVCSRRDADLLIQSGAVKVNGQTITELGFKMKPEDKVTYDGQHLKSEKFQYVLLNKPKDFVTTTNDPDNKKTVMELVKHACKERIYPVGRLDVKTTGLLLFTNDGELAKKLTHPKHQINKLYHVFLDKSFTHADLMKLRIGIELEDGFIKPDEVDYVEGVVGKKEVGIQIHSGKNRVVRRIFEQLGYKVLKLDRVIFAGLSKKDLPRGKCRMLTQKEVEYLRML